MVAFAEVGGGGGDVGEVVGVDCGCGDVVFGFGEGVGEGVGELGELGGREWDEAGSGEGFLPGVSKAVGFRGGGVVFEVFVGFRGGQFAKYSKEKREGRDLPMPASRNLEA